MDARHHGHPAPRPRGRRASVPGGNRHVHRPTRACGARGGNVLGVDEPDRRCRSRAEGDAGAAVDEFLTADRRLRPAGRWSRACGDTRDRRATKSKLADTDSPGGTGVDSPILLGRPDILAVPRVLDGRRVAAPAAARVSRVTGEVLLTNVPAPRC